MGLLHGWGDPRCGLLFAGASKKGDPLRPQPYWLLYGDAFVDGGLAVDAEEEHYGLGGLGMVLGWR